MVRRGHDPPRPTRPPGPRTAVDEVGFGLLFIGEDSVWFSGYGLEEETIAVRVDPDEPAVEEFLSVGDFYHSETAFDSHNHAIWIARAHNPDPLGRLSPRTGRRAHRNRD